MINNKSMAIVACCVFIMIGFTVNGIVSFRNQSRSEASKRAFSEAHVTTEKGIPYNIDCFAEILKKNNYMENNTAAAKVETAVTKSEKNYIIKLIDGKIVVYLEGNTEFPIRITDIEESGLNILLEDFGR